MSPVVSFVSASQKSGPSSGWTKRHIEVPTMSSGV
jgi:hypothetical protein